MLNNLEHEIQQNKCFIGFDVVTATVMKSSICRDITPCVLFKISRRFGGTCRIHLLDLRFANSDAFFIVISCLPYTLMEATCSSETSIDFGCHALRYAP
jgi:hypothetical protein